MEFDNKVRKHVVGNPTRSCDAGAVFRMCWYKKPMVFRLVFSEFAQANPQFRTKWLSGVSCVFLLTSGLAYVYRYGKYDICLYIIFMYTYIMYVYHSSDIDIFFYHVHVR